MFKLFYLAILPFDRTTADIGMCYPAVALVRSNNKLMKNVAGLTMFAHFLF